jgi:predicted HAD superfamily Cof-like phosphohydrolase
MEEDKMTNFGDVGQFHHKFGLPSVIFDGGPKPVNLEDDELQEVLQVRYNFMREELDEFMVGWTEDDIEQMADALVDLVYVAMGTAHFLGLPWEALWAEVQRANMKKVRATGDDDPLSKRHTRFDVVKPEGWRPPDLRRILNEFGWEL